MNICILFLLLIGKFQGQYAIPTVYLKDTRIEGKKVAVQNIYVNQFLGIPYAEPPVGDLRFQRTQPLLQLPKLIRAVEQPPACLQYTQNPFPWYANTSDQSEDCLYLNIWTPSSASIFNPKAVMYWIHGGGFRYGSVRQDLYDASALSALGDIVVVTVNYRLGPFGFLTSKTKDAPGNAGLWDILEGLRWVQKNIWRFGGDPSLVTIAGESAGSIAAGLFSTSPLAKGLFRRQIMESGSPTFLSFDNGTSKSLALTQKMAEMVGCASDNYTIEDHPEEIVKCLKGVDPNTLKVMDSKINPHSSVDFIPVYGDELLPLNAREEIAKGNFYCTDLLIGNNKDEGSNLLTSRNPEIFGFFGEKNTLINKTEGERLMQMSFSPYSNSDAIVDHYLPDTLPQAPNPAIRYQVYTSLGDFGLLCPTVYHAEKCAEKREGRVYFYFWVHRPSRSPWAPWMGATHFSEVGFVFGQPVLHPQLYQPNEVRISKQMIKFWSNFVKFGEPNFRWPKYSRGQHNFRVLGLNQRNPANGKGPHQQNCDFFRPYFGF